MSRNHSNNRYPRGSEWRKWDLHFHTPSSHDYDDKSVTNKELIDVLTEEGIEAVAITDHHFIDVGRIKSLKKIAGDTITIFPGIEFCSSSRGEEPVHFIGIFPEDCDIQYIWGEINSKADIAKKRQEGKKDNEIYCDLEMTSKLIRELGGVVSVHAGRKSNSIERITNSLPVKMAEKEDIAKWIDIFGLGQERDQQGYIQKVFPKIGRYPMIICSDNHNIKDYQIKQYCWIKADPTFEGLKQIVNAPQDRVFVGKEPPILSRVRENRTRYIKQLQIRKTKSSALQEKWFEDVKIPFNSGLVALIGNKGDGKSAILDILGLLSNSINFEDVTFLNENKFKKDKKAKNFEAKLVWKSSENPEKIDWFNLNGEPDGTKPSKVKYIPQSYFETLANEQKLEKFRNELRNIIFTYVPREERLGQINFSDFIQTKTDALLQRKESLVEKIQRLNQKIIELEKQATPDYKKKIENSLEEVEKILEEHKKNKPKEIEKPPEEEEEKVQEIKDLTEEKDEFEEERSQAEKDLETLNSKINIVNNLFTELDGLERKLEDLEEKYTNELEGLDIKFSDIVGLKIDSKSILEEKKKELKSKKEGFDRKLCNFSKFQEKIEKLESDGEMGDLKKQKNLLENNLNYKITDLEKKIKYKKRLLKETQKGYQNYLEELKEWKKRRLEIVGQEEEPEDGTINFYKQKLKHLNMKLPKNIKMLRENRLNGVIDLYKLKKEEVEIYSSLYSPISILLSKHEKLEKYCKVAPYSFLRVHGFRENFLDYINQNRKGYFCKETTEARERLAEILTRINFQDQTGLEKFLERIHDALHNDYVESEEKKRGNSADRSEQIGEEYPSIEQQLFSDKYRDFYDYVYTLNWLIPDYGMKLNGKDLEKLSPGERGILLLVFYLLIDSETIPLIIDQPEENIDNESVYKVLLHLIREARNRRQVILVTHNPNIAVACDADQVIRVNLEKQKQYSFSRVSGSIENKRINKEIVDVLEGTLPAFDTRDSKYFRDQNDHDQT